MCVSHWSSRSTHMRTGYRTAGNGAPRPGVALLLISIAAASLGGCSSVAPLPDSGLVSAFVASQPREPRPPVEIEGDGHEAQRPPPMRMFQREDDPTQPFSPNYGEVPLPQQPDDAEDAPPAPA
ncbi:MAG: hypothetical protein WDN31_20150 [Hyphomicrobium sp.]